MYRRRRIWIGTALTILAGGIILWFWCQEQNRTLVLDNGSVLRYMEALPVGANYLMEKEWHRLARRYLPARFVRWLPPAETVYNSEDEGIAIFFRHTKATAQEKHWRDEFPSRIEVMDEKAFVYRIHGGRGSIRISQDETIWITKIHLPRFPRRQSRFPLFFYDDEDRQMSRIMIENPLPKGFPFPEWTADRLPSTNVVNGVQIVLRGFRSVGELHIDIARVDGKPTPLRLRRWGFMDPTGNKTDGDKPELLSPHEPVWRLAMELYQSRNEEFASWQRGCFENLSVPGVGEVIPHKKSIEVDGVNFRLLLLSGPGNTQVITTVTNGMQFHADKLTRPVGDYVKYVWGPTMGWNTRYSRYSWESNYHFAIIDTLDPGENVELFYRATDQDGRGLDMESSDWFGDGIKDPLESYFQRRYTRGLKLYDGVKSLNVECIVNRGLSVEFFVRSEDVLKSLETN